MRPLRRFIAFFMTSILFLGMLAAPQSLHAAAAQYHADEVIRVGLLFKKSSAQTTEGDNVNTLVAGEDNTRLGPKRMLPGVIRSVIMTGKKSFTPFIG